MKTVTLRSSLRLPWRLQVLTRSSPEGKRILVEMLKVCDNIIGVTGDGTNDGPALKTVHVMEVTGTEVTKEASCGLDGL